MLSMAPDKPDTFFLRIQNPDEKEGLRKKEILVRWSITPADGITWTYVRHEFFERPATAMEWEMTDSYQVPMTQGLMGLIESHLEWEFWREFRTQNPQDESQSPRLPIDRRRLLQILIGWRISKMAQVKTIPQAVDALRHRIGGSLYDMGHRCKISPASLYLASSGARGLSGRYLLRLAELADQLMEWKCSEVLRSHAMVASLNVTRHGGHR